MAGIPAVTKAPFTFLRPGSLVDGDLELVLMRMIPADPIKRYVPAYEFEMYSLGARHRRL